MNKEDKKANKIANTLERKRKKREKNRRKKEERKLNLINCPFDVEMNGLYGTCTCGGDNRQSCLGDT
jgi:hypothetical protein